jgi:hypothetical protein
VPTAELIIPTVIEGLTRQIASGESPLSARKKPPSALEQSQAQSLAISKAQLAFSQAHGFSSDPFGREARIAFRRSFLPPITRGVRTRIDPTARTSGRLLALSRGTQTIGAALTVRPFLEPAHLSGRDASLRRRVPPLVDFVGVRGGSPSLSERLRWYHGLLHGSG